MTNISKHEEALAIKCPACGMRAGVWCGPVLDRAVFHPITTWMHERRYRKSQEGAGVHK